MVQVAATVKDIFRVAAELQSCLQERRWRFCFIGGLALQRWGEPRVTRDVDLTLLTGFSGEGVFIDTLLTMYEPRISDAAAFALESRVLLLVSGQGIGIDIALGGLPFEEAMVARSSSFEFLPGLSLRTCSAEDLVVLKAFADRPRDWADLEGIVIRQRTALDWGQIESALRPLVEVKDAPHILSRLAQLRNGLRAG